MKKFIVSVIALSLICSLAGCAKDEETSSAQAETVSSQATESETASETADSSSYYFDPAAELVENFFSDYTGYWVNKSGGYLIIKTDDDGNGILEQYTKADMQLSSETAESIEASNKTSYVVTFTDGEKLVFEIAESYDGLIGIHYTDGENIQKYVYAGKTADEMETNLSRAMNRAAS